MRAFSAQQCVVLLLAFAHAEGGSEGGGHHGSARGLGFVHHRNGSKALIPALERRLAQLHQKLPGVFAAEMQAKTTADVLQSLALLSYAPTEALQQALLHRIAAVGEAGSRLGQGAAGAGGQSGSGGHGSRSGGLGPQETATILWAMASLSLKVADGVGRRAVQVLMSGAQEPSRIMCVTRVCRERRAPCVHMCLIRVCRC